MIVDSFHAGGFGMYPVLVFGLLLLAAAGRYAMTPEKRFVPLLVALGTLTLSSGAFGFTTGLIATANHLWAVTDRDPYLPILGMGEAMNCVALALAFVVLASLGASLGALRLARKQAG